MGETSSDIDWRIEIYYEQRTTTPRAVSLMGLALPRPVGRCCTTVDAPTPANHDSVSFSTIRAYDWYTL